MLPWEQSLELIWSISCILLPLSKQKHAIRTTNDRSDAFIERKWAFLLRYRNSRVHDSSIHTLQMSKDRVHTRKISPHAQIVIASEFWWCQWDEWQSLNFLEHENTQNKFKDYLPSIVPANAPAVRCFKRARPEYFFSPSPIAAVL